MDPKHSYSISTYIYDMLYAISYFSSELKLALELTNRLLKLASKDSVEMDLSDLLDSLFWIYTNPIKTPPSTAYVRILHYFGSTYPMSCSSTHSRSTKSIVNYLFLISSYKHYLPYIVDARSSLN